MTQITQHLSHPPLHLQELSPSTPKTPGATPKTPSTTSHTPRHAAWRPAVAAAAAGARAALCFVGPGDVSLSGIRLSSGAASDQVRPLIGARSAFHGEVTAWPEPVPK